ncbi:hypothetical protein J3F83DRAFT_744698 [Trichoderma novae-zelandiae]
MRAFAVIYFYKGRRRNSQEYNPEPGLVEYVKKKNISHPELFGYATLQKLASVEETENDGVHMLASTIIRDQRMRDPEGLTQVKALDNNATDEQIAVALDAVNSVRNVKPADRKRATEDKAYHRGCRCNSTSDPARDRLREGDLGENDQERATSTHDKGGFGCNDKGPGSPTQAARHNSPTASRGTARRGAGGAVADYDASSPVRIMG